MDTRSSAEPLSTPPLIANRYRVEKTLGQGGMAVVYQVLDNTTDKSLALKQLVVKGDTTEHKNMMALFDYEFHTLAQMAHPRIIEVYDYGKDDTIPYYTMELLDGGDLKELAPLPWKHVCSLMIDVCSALGLIHSRRQVHRDLTPRNVRCTRDAKAKLIDFGAMVPMGPNKQVVGTPAFTAPEVVTLQTVDGRTDLYSLGATFYYALTGRNAYPSRSFSELREIWRAKPEPPSKFVEDIPKEVDHLVLSLLALDPIGRPINTAEVIEKLSAIAGLEIADQLIVSQAYLSTPTLVGRDEQLSHFRSRLKRAQRGRGGTIVIDGNSGVGRSRFLDAGVLEGKLSAITILRADATDARTGSWGAVKAIAAQLLDALPNIALEGLKPHLSILKRIMPELLRKTESGGNRFERTSARSEPRASSAEEIADVDPSAEVWARGNSWRPPPLEAPQDVPATAVEDPRELRPRVHAALQDWLLQVSREHCLMIAVDDIHAIDEPSAAFFALLSREISRAMLLLVVTIQTDGHETSETAIKLIKEKAYQITVTNLTAKHTEKLLGSVFGDTSNLRLIADRLQAISHGNPRAVMQLTQHLVDKGLITYQSGAWTIPSRIDTGDLPGSMAEALEARVRKLSADALELARTLALSPEQSYSFEECRLLAPHRDTARLIQSLNELVASEILYNDVDYYSFSQRGWVKPLLDKLDKGARSGPHFRLAEMFHKRGNQDFRAAQHLLYTEQEERALDTWVDFARKSKELTDQNPQAYTELLLSLPSDWYESYDAAIRLAQERGRSPNQIYVLLNRLVGLIGFMGIGHTDHVSELMNRLARASGLASYLELGDSVAAKDRLGRALQIAKERYDSTPEIERVLNPFEAIRALSQAIVAALGVVASSYDFAFWQSIPSLEPLAPLSPALGVVTQLYRAMGYRITNRDQEALQKYRALLERLAQPDHGGLEETYYKVTLNGVTRGAGMLEAALGLDSALTSASEIEADPSHRINAWYIRTSYYIWKGDAQKAEECKRSIELLQTQNSPTQWYEGSHLARWAAAYALADDLWGVKQTLDGIEKMAQRFPSWVATRTYVQGEYQRIRGDYLGSLNALQAALKQTAPGRHLNWADIAGAYLRTLLALGRDAEVRTEGRQLLAFAEGEQLGLSCNYLKMPLAIAEAKLGDFENAVKLSDSAIESFKGLTTTGLHIGLAYETRARVAVFDDDYDAFKNYSALCAEQYRTGRNSALTAKYDKFLQESRRGKRATADEMGTAMEWSQLGKTDYSMIMDDCKGPQERAKCALEMLVKQSNSLGGFLYTIQKEGPVLSAHSGDVPPPYGIERSARERLEAELERSEDNTADEDDAEFSLIGTTEWTGLQDDTYHPVVLGHNTQEGYAITGMAVLRLDLSRKFKFPAETVVAISKAFLGHGDVPMVVVSD
jgi:hypothetical protein